MEYIWLEPYAILLFQHGTLSCNGGSLTCCDFFLYGTASLQDAPLQHAELLQQLCWSIFQEGKVPPTSWSQRATLLKTVKQAAPAPVLLTMRCLSCGGDCLTSVL